jgi:UDP-N-acetylglucosamine--N-acetylmuramyl-(pentapeptide) pyrophosphoryl-undecaprenol N-acetylglucosamine transferase
MRILIAGGGTGGHLYPGIALAEEFQSRSPNNVITFVGTKKGIEHRIIPAMGYELITISSAGIIGRGFVRKLTGIVQFLRGLVQGLLIIRSAKPNLAIGTGGYASAPVILAACSSGIETAICEQNSIPGLTNRFLGRFAKKVFIAFEECSPFFPRHKTFLTGNPVRKEFIAEPVLSTREGNRFRILILGGSQGAHSINRAMVDALERLEPLRDKLALIHQTGFQDVGWVAKAYAEKRFQAETHAFITEMASTYAQADIVISRAGALTLTESLICGKPSVLIPYPHAAYNHQMGNAKRLVDQGAARIILEKDLTGIGLGETILDLYAHPEKREEMGQKARSLAKPEAAKLIVDHYCHTNSPEGAASRDA